MAQHSENNQRIARNTLYLYAQMLVQLLVSLFTARVVYQTLGEIDYGIYGIVGGVMSVFFIFNALEGATMRFISFEQGKGSSSERMHTVFSTAVVVHIAVAAVVFILAETVGLYYVCNHLVVPAERLTATIVIYQFSIITAILTILCSPYDALIVAHERMGVFASIGIFNVLTNLLIVFLVQYTKTDKLILYAALVMAIQASMRWIYSYYCKHHFAETRGKWTFDKRLFADMLKFGGWTFNGTLASIGYSQGINLLLNAFFGPLLNTAYSVANIVQNKIYTFAENFLSAVKPQIVKSYAAADYSYLHQLVINSSRFSLLLLFFFSLPIILETHFVMFIWLGDVPEYTVWFVRLSLVMMMVDILGRVMCMAIHATGRIARFQMIEGNMLLLILPIAWLFLHLGYSPVIVLIAQLAVFIATQIARMLIVCPAIHLSVFIYTKQVVLRSLLVMAIATIPPTLLHLYGGMQEHPLTQIICVTATSCITSAICIYAIGCDPTQRHTVRERIRKIRTKLLS